MDNHFSRRGAVLRLAASASAMVGHVAYASPYAAKAKEVAQLEIRTRDYRLDRQSFHTRLLIIGPSPQQSPMAQPPADVREIEFPSGRLHLKAWIGMPKRQPYALPAVIFLHGGFAFGSDDFEMAQPYRDAGFVVVTPTLRGENGQEGTFSMFYDEVEDVLAVAEFVRDQPYIDPAHVYLAGHSVGGTMALLTAMTSSNFKAVASLSGSPDQFTFLSSRWDGVIPFDTTRADEFEMRSPLAYAASLKSPTRLYHGTKEAYFRSSTQRLVAIAQASNLPVDNKELPGDHFGAVPAEIADSIKFFQAHW
jgi:dipeptidyl aminopeptidase/acylaminoacyl peptidase